MNTWTWTCSVLFLSRPRSEGWPHHECTFSIWLYPLSFWLTLPQGVLFMSWCCLSRPCMVFLACVHLALFFCTWTCRPIKNSSIFIQIVRETSFRESDYPGNVLSRHINIWWKSFRLKHLSGKTIVLETSVNHSTITEACLVGDANQPSWELQRKSSWMKIESIRSSGKVLRITPTTSMCLLVIKLKKLMSKTKYLAMSFHSDMKIKYN